MCVCVSISNLHTTTSIVRMRSIWARCQSKRLWQQLSSCHIGSSYKTVGVSRPAAAVACQCCRCCLFVLSCALQPFPPSPSDRQINSFSHVFTGGYSAGYYRSVQLKDPGPGLIDERACICWCLLGGVFAWWRSRETSLMCCGTDIRCMNRCCHLSVLHNLAHPPTNQLLTSNCAATCGLM